MIDFNESDFFIKDIKADGKFSEKTRYKYRVFGLQLASSPVVYISYDTELDEDMESFNQRLDNLKEFLKTHKIILDVDNDVDENSGLISIGLRKDLRENVPLASAILNTIIHCLDGALALDKFEKVKMPVFLDTNNMEPE